MVCTYCGHETAVTNSRHQKRGNTVWRRRRCIVCSAIFSTREQADYEKSWVVQSTDSTLSPFLRDKLFISIYNSCRHRPTALPDSIGLTETVISKLLKASRDGNLQAAAVAAQTHGVLRRFDQAAAMSYLAFHADALKNAF